MQDVYSTHRVRSVVPMGDGRVPRAYECNANSRCDLHRDTADDVHASTSRADQVAQNADALIPSPSQPNRETFASPDVIPGFEDFGHVDLAGISNARDLGGLPAADGRRIRRRRLMRTGELVDATAADIRQICAMHDVDCVIDLRTDAECKRSPEPIPLMHGIEYIHLPAVLTTPFTRDPGAGRVRAARQIYKATERPFKAIHDMYTQALLGAAGIEAYSRFLQILLDAHEGATLWHCTQGKDRTGIAAILIEHVLGVPQEYIMSDYLATNLFVGRLVDKLRVALSRRRITRHLDADIWALAYANTYYFATVYKTLDRNFGGIDAYIERTLGFGCDKQEALRELYLEPALPSAGATGSFRIDAR